MQLVFINSESTGVLANDDVDDQQYLAFTSLISFPTQVDKNELPYIRCRTVK